MIVKVDIAPETEASLAAQAAAQGESLPRYLGKLLEAQASVSRRSPLAPAERAKLWRESVKDIPRTPPLSDEAISRESIYTTRG